MADILTGRALDEAVAKMMGWVKWERGWAKDPGGWDYTRTFRSPQMLFMYVLPWVREQGWNYEIYTRRPDDELIGCLVWNKGSLPIHDPPTGYAHHPDLITTVLNALVRAWEGQS